MGLITLAKFSAQVGDPDDVAVLVLAVVLVVFLDGVVGQMHHQVLVGGLG